MQFGSLIVARPHDRGDHGAPQTSPSEGPGLCGKDFVVSYLFGGRPGLWSSRGASPGRSVRQLLPFEVSSPLSFRFLRSASSGAPLRVPRWQRDGEPEAPADLEWPPRPGRGIHARVYAHPTTTFSGPTGRDGSVSTGSNRRSRFPPAVDAIPLEERLWSIRSALCVVRRDGLALHAAAVESARRGAPVRCAGAL